MSELLKFLEGKSLDEIKEILAQKPYCCEVKEDPDYPEYFLLKYNQIDSDFFNPIVRECRGSIIRKNYYGFVCRPFDKFGNYGEGYVPEIQLLSAHAEEKIDGSLIKVWYSVEHQKWMISTNGVIDAYKAELQSDISFFSSFGEMFDYGIDSVEFDTIDKNFTHLFEVVSPWNRVVVAYPKLEVFYLTSRDNFSGDYVSFEKHFSVSHPKQYSMNSIDEIVQMAKDLPFNNEGYVISDKLGNRVKVKSPAYVAAHHLKNNGVITKKRLLDLILIGETEEFLNYFPEYKENMKEIQNLFDNFMSKVQEDVIKCSALMKLANPSNKEDRRDFALWATKSTLPGLMFVLLDKKLATQDWRDYITSMDSEKLINIIEKE